MNVIHRILCLACAVLALGVSTARADVAALGVTPAMLAGAEQELGAQAAARLNEWQALVQQLADAGTPEKLAGVNAFFNDNMLRMADDTLWEADDYWASPGEFVARGAGDSEDLAIAKFYTLQALDIPEETLRIAYTRTTREGRTFAHMVLIHTASPGAPRRVLDDLEPEIQPVSVRTDLRLVYEFNSQGLFVPRADGTETRAGDVSRLSMWNAMQSRRAAGAW